MSVTIKGLPQLHARLDAIKDGRALLGKLQIDTVAEAKRLAPHKSTNLRRSIVPGLLGTRDALVLARAAYAAYVETGTRPHEIRPRNAQALRFPAKGVQTRLGGGVRRGEIKRLGKGAYVFAKVVHHPGTKPHPFLLPGAQTAVNKNGAHIVIDLWNRAA